MIATSTEGRLTIITLDRPERRNAVTIAGLQALRSAIEAASTPVVYLTGAGEAFCAGADFDTLRSLTSPADARSFAKLGQSVARSIEETDAVVIAGIDGPARGGGVELALACDVRVATPTATFAETGVDVGLFGAWGGTVRLPEVIGLGAALDLSLSGRTISADEAAAMGLVSRVTKEPRTLAATLADKPQRSLPVIKRRLRDRASRSQREQAEVTAFVRLMEAGPAFPD